MTMQNPEIELSEIHRSEFKKEQFKEESTSNQSSVSSVWKSGWSVRLMVFN